MVIAEDPNKSPQNPSKKEAETTENGQKNENLFSPRFRSVAAMAGWDEEALLIASLIVEDTPDRQFKQKKRSDLQSLKTPPTNSRRKRRAQRRSPEKIPVTVLDLDEDESKSKEEIEKTNIEEPHSSSTEEAEKNRGDDGGNTSKGSDVSGSTPSIPCIDRLREELSCAICLEICYEPSTTPCGHSFCKKCLKSAADKCGKKCPKCRQLVSNGRYCTVNTVLWNTIQLLFPQEVEARKAAASASSSNSSEAPQSRTPPRTRSHNTRNRPVMALLSPEPENETGSDRRRNHRHRTRTGAMMLMSIRGGGDVRMRRELPSQDVDAALALRLQREEFMEAFRVPTSEGNGNSLAAARANLRAMASRAINIRVRGRTE